ncbi:MAG TPA: polysaccharide biosynthesis/export family protein [Terriglobales bacterium]|nr:polysaccharide biosynthesis/export family protein [Terriglobales bacterium]
MKPKRSQPTSLVVLLLCLCLSSWVNAQATNGDAKTEKVPPGKPAGAGASANQGAAHDDTYRMGAADVLAVNVWKEPDISRTVTVRSDGKITLPLVGELQAGGLTPRQLEQEITRKLTSYISEPEVTVIVQDSKSQHINILGQVVRPGSYLLTNSMTVLDAIAIAGGFKDFAKQKGIYILRNQPDGTQVKLPFNYKDVIKGKNTTQNVRLAPSDTVVVP